ncbi:hypothetical protein [Zooshikella sp. RANM57]|uniref:hypothetical protein n=1 Tax=Zooshikella sp. RANM57 TaxID=3425863 RepID=UPI003D701378
MRLRDLRDLRLILSQYNLTLLQLEILLAIELNEGATLQDIVGRGHLEDFHTMFSTLSKGVRRLAEGADGAAGKRYIYREVSPSNANAWCLFLTDEAKRILEEIKKEINYK